MISQEKVEIGDTLIMAKGAMLCTIKVLAFTISGSIKYSFSINEDREYYAVKLGEGIEKHNKIGYFPYTSKPYQAYFYLLNRENGK